MKQVTEIYTIRFSVQQAESLETPVLITRKGIKKTYDKKQIL